MRFTAFLLCMGRECAIENGPSRDHLPRTLPSEQKQQTESSPISDVHDGNEMRMRMKGK